MMELGRVYVRERVRANTRIQPIFRRIPLSCGDRRYLVHAFCTAIAVNALFDLAAEAADETLYRPRCGVAERANPENPSDPPLVLYQPLKSGEGLKKSAFFSLKRVTKPYWKFTAPYATSESSLEKKNSEG
jgi:hypothetical protein